MSMNTNSTFQKAQEYTNLIKKFSALELTDVGNYRIISEIGSGAFGKVYLGYHTLLRCKVCLKKGNRNVNELSMGGPSNDNLMREFYYLREYRHHPHITKLYELIFTESSVYMVLEYYPSGDLYEYVISRGSLAVNDSLRIFTQILGAVYYLHKNDCCHRDLKLENILLDKEMNVKLSDFGFTRELPFTPHGTKSLLSEYCGTGAYMAPELVKRVPYSGIKIDIWALGVILYTMLTGEMPFDDSSDPKELEYAIVHNKPRYLESLENLDSNFTNELGQIKQLLSIMLAKDAEDRIGSLEDVLGLPIFESYGGKEQIDIINKLIYDTSNAKNSWSDLTSSEKTLFKNLVNAGIDREILKRAIQEETLDSAYGIWVLVNDKAEKKNKKKSRLKKSTSVLKLTRTRSFISRSRSAFSSSPGASNDAHEDGSNGYAIGSRSSRGNESDNDSSLNQASSISKIKAMVRSSGEVLSPLSRLNSIAERDESRKKDDLSVLSRSTETTTKSTQKNKSKFSVFNIFKTKKSHSSLKDTKNEEDKPLLPKIITINTKSSNNRSTDNFKENASNIRNASMSSSLPKLNKVNLNDRETSKTTGVAQKKSDTTQSGDRLSTYSIQTSASETSDVSGYMTGYSTDANIIPLNNKRNQEASAEKGVKGKSVPKITLNISSEHLGTSSQLNLTPTQTSNNKPRITRAISDWSANYSQAESPSSSFVALSRSNSVDSFTKSMNNRNLSTNARMRRGRSPINKKITTTWAFNIGAPKSKPNFLKPQGENQTIEEETSDQDDDLDEEHDSVSQRYDDSASKVTQRTKKNRGGGRMYMRRGSMKFPILPVTEENEDLVAEDDDEDADVEEDNHDYDDVLTEFSICDFNKAKSSLKTNYEEARQQEMLSADSGSLSGVSVMNEKISQLSFNENRVSSPTSGRATPLNLSKKRTSEHLLGSPLEPTYPSYSRIYSPTPGYTKPTKKAMKTLEQSISK